MSRKAVDPMEKILELYRDLPGVEARKAVMAAMRVFSGEPVETKPKRQAKPKIVTQQPS